MTPKLKQKWIDALRSGEYQQATGCLHTTGNQYCCLGVLHIVAMPGAEVPPTQLLDGDLLEQFGLSEVLQNHLAGLNDNARLSFEEIADILEKIPHEDMAVCTMPPPSP